MNANVINQQAVELRDSLRKHKISDLVWRVMWIVFWALFCSWTPKFARKWRCFVLRCFGARIGQDVLIFGSTRIEIPWNLEVGDFSTVGPRCKVYNHAMITIGMQTVISQDSVLCTATHDYESPEMTFITSPISIGDYAWIAAEAFVHPGVRIGDGTVVGARSVVTSDLPEWMVCIGAPCRPRKSRVIRRKSVTSP